MAAGKHCIGLDIGSSAVKLCLLEREGDVLSLKAFDHTTVPPDTVVNGTIMDNMAVTEAIETLVERNSSVLGRRKMTAMSLSGNSVIVKRITLPAMSDEELDESIEWEAEQYIPFDIEEVYLGHETVVPRTEQGQMDVVLVAAKKEMVDNYRSVGHQVGLTPIVMDVDVFCLQNMYEFNYGFKENETVVLLDIGNSVVSLDVVEGGVTVFTRDLMAGGSRITKEIQQTLNITYKEAELYKLGGRPGEGDTDQVLPEEVESIIQNKAEELANEVQRSLEFYASSSSIQREVSRIVVSGGTSAIESLVRRLEEASGVPTEHANPFRQIERDPAAFPEEWLEQAEPIAGISVGLSLRQTRES